MTMEQQPPQTQQRLKPKIGRNVVTCASIAVAALLIIVSLFGVAVAKSGLVRVPVFSAFYQGLRPTRTVVSKPLTLDGFRTLVGSRLRTEALSGAKPPFNVVITEQELTGVMRSAVLEGLKGQSWQVTSTQIVIQPSFIEISGEFTEGIWRLDLVARFRVNIHDGGASFEPTYLRLGDYPLPPSVAYQAVSYLFSRDLGTFVLSFAGTKMQDVRLGDGTMTIVTGAASE